jgi:hypothetical protein
VHSGLGIFKMAAIAMETVNVCQNKKNNNNNNKKRCKNNKSPNFVWGLNNTADKIGKISMFSDFNENLYLGLF